MLLFLLFILLRDKREVIMRVLHRIRWFLVLFVVGLATALILNLAAAN